MYSILLPQYQSMTPQSVSRAPIALDRMAPVDLRSLTKQHMLKSWKNAPMARPKLAAANSPVAQSDDDHHVDEALADPRSPFLLVVGSAAPQVAGEILVAGQLELAAVALEHLAAAPRVGVVLLHLEDERPHGKGAREDVLATREHKQAMLKQLDHKALVQTSSVRIVAANGSHPRPQAVPRHQDGTEHPVAPSEHISKRAAVEDQQAAAPCELRQQLSAATRENHLAVPHAVL
mmetsp:Transcript_123653/g.395076  ORF Transcript_123653/g.395076 Transcript_123653/m.395076 type:complete len:234 (-) Transcript_123653:684-1385(-)